MQDVRSLHKNVFHGKINQAFKIKCWWRNFYLSNENCNKHHLRNLKSIYSEESIILRQDETLKLSLRSWILNEKNGNKQEAKLQDTS